MGDLPKVKHLMGRKEKVTSTSPDSRAWRRGVRVRMRVCVFKILTSSVKRTKAERGIFTQLTHEFS